MALAPTGDLQSLVNQSPLGSIAPIIQALAPIFLGTGKTTGTTAQTAGTTTAGSTTGATTGQTTQQTTTGADPAILANLIAQLNQANSNATNPQITQSIVDNIIKLNTEAFAPTIGQANASGIYNSSTLGLLAGEAAARSSAEAASTALNFRTSEQQIAAGIGNNLLTATKTTGTTGTAGQQTQQNTQQQQNQQSQGTTTQQTAPVIGASAGSNLLTGVLGLAGSVGLNKLLSSNAVGNASSSLLDNILPNQVSDFLGLSTSSIPAGGVGNLAEADFPNPPIPPGLDVASTLGQGGAVGGNIPFSSAASTAPGVIADPSALVVTPGAVSAAAGNPLLGQLPGLSTQLGGPTAPPGPGVFATTSEPIAGIGGVVDTTGVSDPALEAINAGVDSTVASTAAAGFGQGGFSSFFQPTGSLSALPGDISNLIQGIEGSAGSVVGDIAAPISGFIGNELGSLVDKSAKPVGADIGGAIGGTLGSFFGPIGSGIGSFAGHLIGGLFGPNQPKTFSSTGLILNSDGTLKLGKTVSQQDPNAAAATSVFGQQVGALNNLLTSAGLKIANPAPGNADSLGQTNRLNVAGLGAIQLGINTPGGASDPSKFSDLNALFPKLQFTSDNPSLAGVVNGKSFNTPQDLINALQGAPTSAATSATSSAASPQITAAAASQTPIASFTPPTSQSASPSFVDVAASLGISGANTAISADQLAAAQQAQIANAGSSGGGGT